MHLIAIALDKLQGEENAYMGVFWPTLFMAEKKLREHKTSNTVAICLLLIKSLHDRFDGIFHSQEH